MDMGEARQLADRAVEAMRRGDPKAALQPLEALTATGRASGQVWLLLAQANNQLGNAEAEGRALDSAIEREPGNIRALLMKGDLLEKSGDSRAAHAFRQAALVHAQGAQAPLPAELSDKLSNAEKAMQRDAADYVTYLYERLENSGHKPDRISPRFAEALDVATGKKQVYFQQPTSFFYPRLPHIQFYERDAFDWAPEVESAAPAMLQELKDALEKDEGLRPYVEPEPNRPPGTHALLDDPRWSAFDLIKEGEPVEPNASRCPQTLQALGNAPLCAIRGRGPMALFSVLRPGTHIPPHHGMFNTRLICHLPLIVPEGCRLRVGNETRGWRFGELLIFDDSIEHEAWNDSAETRVVLIFEVWRPELDEEERSALTALFEAIEDYGRPA